MSPQRPDADASREAHGAAWLRGERQRVRQPVLLAATLGALGGFLLVPQAWLLAHALSDAVVSRAPLHAVLPWLWPLLLVFAVRFALAQATERSAFEAAALVRTEVRDRLLRHLQSLGPAFARGAHSGEIAVTAIDAVEALEPYYARYLPQVALVAAVPTAILASVLPRDPISALVLVLTAPVIPLFMMLVGRSADRLSARQWKGLARMAARFLDAFRGLATLATFDAAGREAQVLARLSEDYRRDTMRVLRVAFLSALVLEFFATVSIALLAVLIGFRLMSGSLTFEAGVFVLLLAPEFYLPLRQLGTQHHARMEAVAAAERIAQVLSISPPTRAAASPASLPLSIDIRFDDVHFAYAPGREALRGASFSIEAQRVTALVGASGAGKSTALDLMMGFLRPQRGRVLVGGRDLAAIDREDWMRRVAWLPQRPHVFAGSILDNIRMGDAGIGHDAVRAAARLAHAESFIERLPLGYDTPVGERGQTLSGGEARRLALARAFLKDAPVLVMDEATASLDAATEALVAEAIASLSRGRTVLAVAHRVHTVQGADRIVVLDEGRVVEEGTHDALLRRGAHYARMIEAGGLRG